MKLEVITHKCTGCRICEIACSFHRDREMNPVSSSIMLHRNEKKDYFGVMIKREKEVFLGRPEGAEVLLPGEKAEGAGASSKPIVMREACDLCEGEDFLFCVAVCPSGCLVEEGGAS